MEAVENALVEGKILWLAQTILEGIFSGEHDEWIRHVGLGEGMKQLKSEIERVETVVAAVKGRATGNKPLAGSLARLSELMYDADDLVDELDYFRLQEQVERGTIACANESERTDGHEAEQVEGSRDNPHIQTSKRRTNRCKEWDHFTEIMVNGKTQGAKCKYCGKEVKCGGTTGTNGLNKHIRSKKCLSKRPAAEEPTNTTSSTDGAPNDTTNATRDSFIREKRMRVNEASTHSAASNTRPWNKAGLPNRIRQIVFELQDSRGNVCDFLKDSVACSVQSQSNSSDTRTTTSSCVPREVHGRDVEKDYIIRVITAAESNVITVLPIVGIVGVGKTALAQLVYNDPTVISQFERIWIWVSDMFDKVRLTNEMLDVVALESHNRPPRNKESHEGQMRNYSKLQEILKEHMGHRSKRFFLVLDDVTDCMDSYQWNELLSPLKSSQKKGNVIVITTRNLSVARRLGTVEPIKLVALKNDAFWLLFKACAFGDDNYERHPSLNIIGRQIAAKLKGNPLAAQTAGEVLKKHLTIDHWSTILKSEDQKSMLLNTGIMHALKLSYDKLPYHLQQCFLYCSIFPDNYKFLAEDLVRTWISQGFLRCKNSKKTPEETGRDYLHDLVDLCFFEEVEKEESSPTQGAEESTPPTGTCYVMCGIMYEFARVVSGSHFATICGLERNEILPTIRHVSIHSILNHKEFEEKLQTIVPLVRNLRTLILIGRCESFFFQSFQDIFQKACHLRLLQISATQANFYTSVLNLVNPTHIRYLKFGNNGSAISLSKFYHLQVLDAGHPTIVHGVNDLISMRYLFVTKGARSFIPRVGETSNSQDMQNSTDQNSSRFEITQLRSMNKLVQLGVFHLVNVSRSEADGAKLRDKQQLEKLILSWKDTNDDISISEAEEGSSPTDDSDSSYTNDDISISEVEEGSSQMDDSDEEGRSRMDDSDPNYGPLINTETERERSQTDGSNNSPRSGPFIDMAHDVLEGLEPHQNLKHLQISGYSGSTSPAWLATSVTFLQALHLEDCGEWKILPSLESLKFLTKLKLSNMQKVKKVSIVPLEELVLINMPKLECCSCNSVMDLNSSLRVLKFEQCHVLKVFPLFESWKKLKIERKSWLSCVKELTICECPHLMVPNPLPPSSNVCKLHIARVSTLPTMEGSSSEKLNGWLTDLDDRTWRQIDKNDWLTELDDRTRREINKNDGLTELDDRILSFHNLRALSRLHIAGCQKLSSISLEGFRQLISLKTMDISFCINLFSSDVPPPPEHTHEDMTDINFNALPSLKHLRIEFCGITGMWVSVMLRHAPALEELRLDDCDQISGLLIEVGDSSSSNHTSAPRAPSAGNPDDALTSSTPDGLLRIPSNSVSSLKKMSILWCRELTFQGNKEGFSGFTSLEELKIAGCPKLIPSLVQTYENNDQRNGRWLLPYSLGKLDIEESPETLQPCFLEDHNCLKKLKIRYSPSLKLVQLHSCTALEELTVYDCASLAALEGNFTCLRKLDLFHNPRLKSLQLHSCTTLEELMVQYCASLAALEGNFTCLRKLYVFHNPRLKSLQLHSCTTLEELMVQYCASLAALEGNFTCLRKLDLFHNPRLKSLQLHSCTTLEELMVYDCASLAALEGNFTCLRKLYVFHNLRLKSLQLHSCTTLEELTVEACESLAALEDFRSLRGLRYLKVTECPGLLPYLEHLSSQGYELCAGLERLHTDDYSFLTTSFCKCLTSLRRLELHHPTGKVTGLTEEQERALQHLTSLQELRFEGCSNLAGLPVGLHSLSSLK
uniref:BED-type domain-containing protein n=1 Tax=Setaria italica TaxID=4555 RepID=K3Z292_SETIT